MKPVFLTLILLAVMHVAKSQNHETIYLWPGNVPGETEPKQPQELTNKPEPGTTYIIKNNNPCLVVYPTIEKSKGCVVICPGGGYNLLAIDKEGYEIAEWFASKGITAYVLQYRVPQKRSGALQDVQRAIRIVRQQNADQKIGVMGFSAGASLSARASTLFDQQTYKAVDAADQLSARPDFTALIYPAYLDEGENRSLTPELKITDTTPSMFLFATLDDFYGNSALVMTTAMRDHKRPAELHMYPFGGHGYGLRKGSVAAETWPVLLEKWLNNTL